MMEEEDIAPDPDTAIHYITPPHIEDMDLELDYDLSSSSPAERLHHQLGSSANEVYGAEATEAALAFYLVLGISGFLVTSATLTAVYLTLTKQVVFTSIQYL